jgi:hypothetical protein
MVQVYLKGVKFEGGSIMVNNQNVYSPKEQFNKTVDDFMKQVFKSTEDRARLKKERDRRYATIKKATKRRLKQQLKKY